MSRVDQLTYFAREYDYDFQLSHKKDYTLLVMNLTEHCRLEFSVDDSGYTVVLAQDITGTLHIKSRLSLEPALHMCRKIIEYGPEYCALAVVKQLLESVISRGEVMGKVYEESLTSLRIVNCKIEELWEIIETDG